MPLSSSLNHRHPPRCLAGTARSRAGEDGASGSQVPSELALDRCKGKTVMAATLPLMRNNELERHHVRVSLCRPSGTKVSWETCAEEKARPLWDRARRGFFPKAWSTGLSQSFSISFIPRFSVHRQSLHLLLPTFQTLITPFCSKAV